MAINPEEYEEVFEDIIGKIVETSKPIRDLIRESGISTRTFFELLDIPDNEKRYARAMKIRAEIMAFEILEISDDNEHDTIVTENGEKENKEWVNRSRLRVDSRKWLMSKMLPKKYGDNAGKSDDDGDHEIIIKRI